MQRSESIKELAEALAIAQGQFGPVKRTRTATVNIKGGGGYSYSYADLSDVIEATRDALAGNGLAITQDVDKDPQGIAVTTTLFHKSGEFLATTFRVPAGDFGNNAVQAMGGTATYARRYGLCALLNIASDEDTDAADAPTVSAGPGSTKAKQAMKPIPPGSNTITYEEYKRIREETIAAVARITEPEEGAGWSTAEKDVLGSKNLLSESGKHRDTGLLSILLQRAQIGEIVRGTERWAELMSEVIDAGTNLEALKAIRQRIEG